MSFFVRILGRRSGKTAGARDPENWQVGDWAECIGSGRWFGVPDGAHHAGPRHGRIGQVTGVRLGRNPLDGARVLALAFAPWPDSFFDASCFRKVNPRADQAVAAEAEFTELVRRQPARQPAPAMPRETIREWQ